MDITHITSLLGGIALFLYGMSIMGAGLEKLAGGKMQGVLQKLTSSTLKGVIFGTLITGVIQSSAGTVVILCRSGQLRHHDPYAVGRRHHGCKHWYDCYRPADPHGGYLRRQPLADPDPAQDLCAGGGVYRLHFFMCFLRSAKRKNIGQIMLGFGILFTGMSLMDTGVAPLRESAVFQNLFVTMTNPILGILVGVVVTVIIQSSSASVGILQALSSTGLVTFSSAIPIILGAHIGTAFTPLLTIGGSSKDGKRAALIHLYFNIIGSVILLALVYAVQFTVGIPMWNDVMNKSTIANIHTLSSVCAMLLFLPVQRCAVQAGHAHCAGQRRGSTGAEHAGAGRAPVQKPGGGPAAGQERCGQDVPPCCPQCESGCTAAAEDGRGYRQRHPGA